MRSHLREVAFLVGLQEENIGELHEGGLWWRLLGNPSQFAERGRPPSSSSYNRSDVQ